MIDRRTFVGVATGGLVAAALSVRAQQPDKVWRVGLLDPGIPHLFAAFRGAMRELGYIEGRNITFEVKSAQGERERTSAAAAELVALKPDAIVTASPLAIRAARSATATIPIIAVTGDAVATGLVTNLAQPEGNVTGLSFLNTELSAKRIEVFKEALPRLTKLAMLNDLSGAQSFAAATRPAAQRLGIQLQQIDVRRSGDLERAFGDAKRGGAEAIDVLASAYFNASRDEIVKLAAQSRLPAIYESREYVDAGGLMSYGQDLFALFRRSAYFLDKILKGTPIRDLPWEQPTNFQLVINLKTAKVLGLTIPQSLLLRANDVI